MAIQKINNARRANGSAWQSHELPTPSLQSIRRIPPPLVIASPCVARAKQFVEFANEVKQPSTLSSLRGRKPEAIYFSDLESKMIPLTLGDSKGDSTDSLFGSLIPLFF